MHSLYSKDPEYVLEQQQLGRIKREQGCAACESRDKSVSIPVCGIKGNYPGRAGYCDKWHFDEGVNDDNYSETGR